jgi:hypothetical protein
MGQFLAYMGQIGRNFRFCPRPEEALVRHPIAP